MSQHLTAINNQLAQLLSGGAVGVMPSDTIYGLSCIATSQSAVEKLFKVKGRGQDKPCIVLISDIDQLTLLGLDKNQTEPIAKYWPGPLTLECKVSESTPDYLHRGKGRFGVRMPNKPELLELIRKTGPILSTSANLEGQPPALTIDEAKEYFKDTVDFYVDVGKLEGNPSTLVGFVDGQLVVYRQGEFKLPGQ